MSFEVSELRWMRGTGKFYVGSQEKIEDLSQARHDINHGSPVAVSEL